MPRGLSRIPGAWQPFFSGIRPGHGGVQPGAVGCSRRDAQALGRLLERQPGEEPHLHQLGLDGVVLGELLQGLVQGQDFLCGAAGQQGVEVGGVALPAAAALETALAPRLLDQDAAHGRGGRGEEMAAPVPVGRRARPDEPEVGLVNQGGRLQGLAGLLVREPLGGQPAQFVVDQR